MQIPKRIRERVQWHEMAKQRANRPVPCLCCWYDVYNFGTCLAKNNWQLGNAAVLELMEVLNNVYNVAAGYRLPTGSHVTVPRLDRVLVLNDGVARTTDVSESEEPHLMAQYLVQLLSKHYLLAPILDREGLGLRTVLAGGERIQYAPTGVGSDETIESWKISRDETVDGILPYNPAEFQMNVAFSRAYIIESAGHKYGIENGWLYFDQSFVQTLRSHLPGCIDFEGARYSGELWLTDGTNPLLTVIYDKKIKLSNVHRLSTTVFRVSEYIVHSALEGELTWIPLDLTRINAFQEAVASDGVIDVRRPLPYWVREIEEKWCHRVKHRY